jgi:glycosyltransferase involved in cell wall biosynthesis
MRILHVITALRPDSAGHHVRLLVRALPHQCEVATLSRSGPVAEALRAGGTRVHELAARGDLDVPTGLALRRLIRAGDFDVVHTHLYRACVLGRVAARLAGSTGVVGTEHALTEVAVDGRAATRGVRTRYLAGERAGRVTIAVSAAVAGRLRDWGVRESRITVIPGGIDPAEFRFRPAARAAVRARLGIVPDASVVGAVGRLEPGKRFDRLIRSLTAVPGATLLLVGDGPARAALQRLAAIEGVAGRVVFAGAVGHTRDVLSAMDVFASPCDREEGGLAVLEALAAGLPALYASCPPLEERDRTGSPVAATQRLSRDPESLPRALRAELFCLAERRGRRLPARSVGGPSDADRMAAEVAQVYDRVAGQRAGRVATGSARNTVHLAASPRTAGEAMSRQNAR